MAEKRVRYPHCTERGLMVYGQVRDDRGDVVRVQDSSAAAKAYCYVFVHDDEGRSARLCPEAPGGATAVAAHLTRAQARRLARLLLRFADGGSR